MSKPIELKTIPFSELIENIKERERRAKKEFEENGGMCIACGKNPGEKEGINPYCCKECNKETENLLDQLRGSGFTEVIETGIETRRNKNA